VFDVLPFGKNLHYFLLMLFEFLTRWASRFELFAPTRL
jgi:hypothetical protein